MLNVLASLWAGEPSLAQALRHDGILGGPAVNLAATLAAMEALANDAPAVLALALYVFP